MQRDEKGQFVKGSVPHNKGEHIKKNCKKCGKGFSVKPSLDRVQHCSRRCAQLGKPSSENQKKAARLTGLRSAEWMKGIKPWNKGMKGFMAGEQHPNWKGGYSEAYRARRNGQYKNWRTSVFERDNYTCRDCGANGCYITAHHIKSFAYFPELRYELSNGLTLCEPCHMKTDNYKGRGQKLTKV